MPSALPGSYVYVHLTEMFHQSVVDLVAKQPGHAKVHDFSGSGWGVHL